MWSFSSLTGACPALSSAFILMVVPQACWGHGNKFNTLDIYNYETLDQKSLLCQVFIYILRTKKYKILMYIFLLKLETREERNIKFLISFRLNTTLNLNFKLDIFLFSLQTYRRPVLRLNNQVNLLLLFHFQNKTSKI